MTLNLTELDAWAEDFLAFHAQFAPLFARAEPRAQALKYLRGLLSAAERKNSWHLAEVLGDATPDRMQRLLYRADWDADAARDILQDFLRDTLGDPEGIGVIDETGFLKKGTHSVGVQRQYSGTAGKVENCQIGTFLSYATAQGHVFLDRRLYLPQSWTTARARCTAAQVPADIGFQTKPEQAGDMLEHAWAQGLPMRWVTGDEVYGDAPDLRDRIATAGRWYVLAVSSTARVWSRRPAAADEAAPAATVREVVAAWPERAWSRLTVAEGDKGPRVYDWGCCRVVESAEGQPGRDGWLVARRSVSDPREIAYYLSNAPAGMAVQRLAEVAATRYTVEQCLEEAKGEAGLDQYEVRTWPSWHRHITLVMMAHTWLAAQRAAAAQKGGPASRSWRG